MVSNLFRIPISKSFGSCAGVTFTHPVPNSKSTYSSENIGISLFTIGNITVFPIKCLYLLSLGFTAIPVSPSMVSGLVVATTIHSSLSLIGYLKCHKFPSISLYITSSSDNAVNPSGSQLIILSP